mmetsp:Transcript_5022/g.8757  ORF Transcript_5022/g.8757 Transcript_5022/m.8757 type:complete len:250 (-) Transcript_5022:370-1119(-)
MLYGAAVWDPALIIAQIVSIQCLFYLSLGLWQLVFLGPYMVTRLSIYHLFSWRLMDLKTFTGWMLVMANLVNAPLAALYLYCIVERAKKCLDFAATCYLFHLIFCCVHEGFPTSLGWWLSSSAGLLVMALLGEWLCVRKEMQDIPLNTVRQRQASAVSTSSGPAASTASPSLRGRQPSTAGNIASNGTGGVQMSAFQGAAAQSASMQGSEQGRPILANKALQDAQARDPVRSSLSRTNSRSRLLGDNAV